MNNPSKKKQLIYNKPSSCFLITHYFTQKVKTQHAVHQWPQQMQQQNKSYQSTLTQESANFITLNNPSHKKKPPIVRDKKTGQIQTRRYKNKHPSVLRKKILCPKSIQLCDTCRTYPQLDDSQNCKWCTKIK